MEIQNFREILLNYETIFFDAYGVLKNHHGLFPGIENTFKFLEEHNIDFFILTNDASRSPSELAEGYQKKGLHYIKEEKIVSSGMLAKEYLELKVKSGTVAYLGTEESAHYIESAGLHTVSIKDLEADDADHISALVFLDDEGFNWSEDINKTVNLLRNYNIPVIVSNTDVAYPVENTNINIAIGGLADLVERVVGKKFIRFGKPDAQMFIFGYEHSVYHGGTSDKNKILMVGDTLITDIIGGNKFGLDTALVLTGNTLHKHAEMWINHLGISPTYICDSAGIINLNHE